MGVGLGQGYPHARNPSDLTLFARPSQTREMRIMALEEFLKSPLLPGEGWVRVFLFSLLGGPHGKI
jgi:hypothetical protein